MMVTENQKSQKREGTGKPHGLHPQQRMTSFPDSKDLGKLNCGLSQMPVYRESLKCYKEVGSWPTNTAANDPTRPPERMTHCAGDLTLVGGLVLARPMLRRTGGVSLSSFMSLKGGGGGGHTLPWSL